MTPAFAFAQELNGSEYPFRLTANQTIRAQDARLVVAYGESDDLLEFEGSVYEEVGAYEGGEAFFNTEGILQNKCPDDACPYFQEKKNLARKVTSSWGGDHDGYNWVVSADFAFETFDVFEDGKLFCRGIVFCLDDCVK